MDGQYEASSDSFLELWKKLPLPATKATQQRTSLWPASDHPAVFSSPLQSGPVPCTKTPLRLVTAIFLEHHMQNKHRRTLFPVPLPIGGWHSQAWRMAHSMSSTRAVSWRSVKAKTSLSLSLYWKGKVGNGLKERLLTLFSRRWLIQ